MAFGKELVRKDEVEAVFGKGRRDVLKSGLLELQYLKFFLDFPFLGLRRTIAMIKAVLGALVFSSVTRLWSRFWETELWRVHISQQWNSLL